MNQLVCKTCFIFVYLGLFVCLFVIAVLTEVSGSGGCKPWWMWIPDHHRVYIHPLPAITIYPFHPSLDTRRAPAFQLAANRRPLVTSIAIYPWYLPDHDRVGTDKVPVVSRLPVTPIAMYPTMVTYSLIRSL